MNIKEDQWVWVIISGHDGNEQMLGQHDSEAGISFIPGFLSKDDAINALGYLRKDFSQTYSVQAILYEDLKRYSKDNGFMIFILKATGEIIEKLAP